MSAATAAEPWLLTAPATAVERFSARHDDAGTGTYRSLLPAAAPRPGQQYAFEVDLDSCTGCKSCVVACKSLNGLDPDESWRSVGVLRTVGGDRPVVQTVTTGCHHCVDPGCLAGCPVDAYEKDPVTGIVAHLDDQCIGCRYCTLTCPYEVPRYNPARGIVRKCDMCAGRLAAGEAPACAQACPNGAIRIAVVDVAGVPSSGALVPGAPDSAITRPATVYRTGRAELSGALAADDHVVTPAHDHPPLVAMLVLTQLAVGLFVADAVAPGGGRGLLALATGVLAMGASVLHLGRPLLAWRVAIGLRHSWLSREAVAFGAFAGAAAVHAVAPSRATAAAGVAAGAAGIWCSAMIYAVTRRALWRLPQTVARFTLTAVAGGSLLVAPGVGAAASLLWLAWDVTVAFRRRGPLAGTAQLLRRDLAVAARLRCLAGGASVLAATVAATATGAAAAVATAVALLAVVASGFAERSLFFRAATAPRMPGSFG